MKTKLFTLFALIMLFSSFNAIGQMFYTNQTVTDITATSATINFNVANAQNCNSQAFVTLQISSLNNFSNSAGTQNFTTIPTFAATPPLSYNATGLTPGVTYYWRVSGSQGNPCSNNFISQTQTFTTTSQPISLITFSNLTSSAITNTTATVSVTLANVCAGSNYRLQVAPSADFGVGTLDTPHQTDGTNGVKNHNLTDLDPNKTYYYRFYASPGQGCGNTTQIVSDVASFTTTGGNANLFTFSNVTSSAITNTTATVGVTLANVCAGASYNLQYSTSSDFSVFISNINNLTAGANGVKTHNLTGLEPNTIYYFRFYVSPNQACNTAEIISPSGSFTTTTGSGNDIVFSNLTSSAITNIKATVSVTLANVCVGATYRIQYSTSSTFSSSNGNVLVDNLISTNVANGVNNVILTGLTPNTQYFYRFYGSGSQTCSPNTLYSTTANFITANTTNMLIAEYNFNNTLNNINGNTPFDTLPANLYAPGRSGALQALTMDSGSRQANITNIPSGNAPRTISLWIKMTGTGDWTICYYGQQSANNSYGLSFKNGLITNYGWSNDLTGNVGVPLNVWKHIVCTYSATGQATIYLDGVEIGTGAKTAWNTTLTAFRLNNFPGLVDDLKIYNYAISGSEVTSLFTSDNITPTITPTFAQVPSICSGATLAALPTTSTNGITGSWAPALDNTTTTSYTFTPTEGQDATTATMTITVNPLSVTPAFAAVAPICSGGTLAALPTTATNGITGTWSPALSNTATTTYTFTPTAGQCANTTTMTIVVNTAVMPTATTTAASCTANGTASISNYNASFTYVSTPSGATVGTSGLITGTAGTAYTFVASSGSCSSVASASVTIPVKLVAPVAPTATTTAATCSANGTASISNYNASFTYVSTPSGATVGTSGLITGTAGTAYTFVATSGTCSSVASASVTIPVKLLAPVAPTTTTTAASCTANGTASISNYNASFTYVSTPSGATVGTSGLITGTAGTAYTFVATSGSCSSIASASVTIPVKLVAPVAPTATTTAASCTANGTASISNYNASFTYVSTPSGATVGTSGLITGTAGIAYTFVATSGSCSSVASASVTIPLKLVAPIAPTATTTAASCTANGTASISNYNASFTYVSTPSGATVGTSGLITGTAGTAYTFVATSGSCSSIASASVTIPVKLVAPVAPTATTTAASCTANGTASISNYNASLTYVSTPSGATVGTSGLITGTAGTAYTFVATSGSCSSTASASVTIPVQLAAPTAPTASANQTFVEGATIASLITTPSTVLWYATNADAVSGNNPLASTTLLATGTYYAVNVVGGCRSSVVAVTVSITLGTENVSKISWMVYPNPVIDVLNIEMNTEIQSIEIYNVQGQKMLHATQKQINVSHLASGMYIIRIQDSENAIANKKFMKK